MTFQAYPKWITLPDGKRLIAQNEEEEKSHLTSPAPKNDLLQKADSIGLKADGRWSESRLASEIEKAEAEK